MSTQTPQEIVGGISSCWCIGHFVAARVHQTDVCGVDTEVVRCIYQLF